MNTIEATWDLLFDANDLAEKINILKNADREFFDSQPGAIPGHLLSIDTMKDAFTVANIFKNKMGLEVVCHEETYYTETPLTIMDVLENETSDKASFWLLRYAFNKLKFVRARDMDPLKFMYLYCESVGCRENAHLLGIQYDYERMKKERVDLRRELAEILYKPDRIQEWIDAGNDIEDYLQ